MGQGGFTPKPFGGGSKHPTPGKNHFCFFLFGDIGGHLVEGGGELMQFWPQTPRGKKKFLLPTWRVFFCKGGGAPPPTCHPKKPLGKKGKTISRTRLAQEGGDWVIYRVLFGAFGNWIFGFSRVETLFGYPPGGGGTFFADFGAGGPDLTIIFSQILRGWGGGKV